MKECEQNCNTNCKTTAVVPSDILIIAFSIADFKRFSETAVFFSAAILLKDADMQKGRPFGRPCGCAVSTSPLLFAYQIV